MDDWRRRGDGSALLRRAILACSRAGAWLAAASPALAARQVIRLADAAQDPRLLAIAAVLLLAAWLGIAGGWRTGHRHR